MQINIRRAVTDDVDQVVHLFDAYRQFYGRECDTEAARVFLTERLSQEQSVLFLAAHENGSIVGFTQLYPSFSSVSLKRIFIFNDLYVQPEARRGAIGEKLIEAAIQYAKQNDARGLSLSTAISNKAAQRLYEKAGWQRDEQFYVYNFLL
jgi:ribosomal protein S18 acetylase RimI-like enzyme